MSNSEITSLYSQGGGDLPFFVGKQYGGGWLRTLARFAFPILRRVLGVATNTAEDVIVNRKKFGQSLRDNSMNEVRKYMSGRGKKRRRRARSSINKRMKRDYSNTIVQ